MLLPLRFVCPCVSAIITAGVACCWMLPASAQDMPDGAPLLIEVSPEPIAPVILPVRNIELNLQPSTDYSADRMAWDSADDGETFRRQTRDKTLKLLLYGVTDNNASTDTVQNSNMPQVSRNLKQFMDGHFASIKKDYFTQEDPTAARLVAGDPSFISETMTRGMAQKPAKLAGATIPIGENLTFGGGYTWGETNPTLVEPAKRGMIVGLRYNAGNVPIQVSYLSAGRDVAGFSTGGKELYDNLMIGASIPVKDKFYINSTIQYRNDRSRVDNEQQQLMITFGTKIKF